MTKAPMKLRERYVKEIAPKLKKDLGCKNSSEVPKVTKITVNVGVGSLVAAGNKDLTDVIENVRMITGQQPVVKNAKKAISNFKLREGMPVGISVTLRGERMYDFISKLVSVTLPRVRDFRGITTKAFDKQGNYSLGFPDHLVFPEINPDDITKVHGIQVCITTTAKNAQDGHALLREMGFPFREDRASKQ